VEKCPPLNTDKNGMADSSNEVSIPKWFLSCVSAVLALSIPWAGWVTLTLARISVRMESQTEMRKRTGTLEARFTEHIADPEIHHAAVISLEQRVGVIERRINNAQK